MADDMIRRQTRLGKETRAATVAPSTYDAESHTVELAAATGYEVTRWSWDGQYLERLQISDAAIDLSRVEANQCPALDTHSAWSVDDQFGKIIAGRVEDGVLILTLKFAQSLRGQEIEARVASGELTGCSVGYRRLEMVLAGTRNDVPIYEVTQWMLLECSLCPVPADPDSGVRSAQEETFPCFIIEERKVPAMPDTPNDASAGTATGDQTRAVATPPVAQPGAFTQQEIDQISDVLQRMRRSAAVPPAAAAPAAQPSVAPAVRLAGSEALDFAALARSHGIDDATARTWIDTLTPDQARAELVRKAGENQNKSSPAGTIPQGQAARVGQDDRDTYRAAAEELMLHRTDPAKHKVTDRSRNLMGMSLLEMGRSNLEANGTRTGGMSRRELAAHIMSRAHGTSDFPNILANVTGKTLRDAYETAGQTFKAWQRRTTAPDFKQITRLQMSAAPGFIQVPEGGEYTMGYLGEAKEVYSLAKYGRLMAFTYEMLINDDLGAFTRIVEMMGAAAADFESDVAYVPLLGNPNMGDSIALFHASHGNLAGSGAAPSETTLSAAFLAMNSQTALASAGETARTMNLMPKYFISGMSNMVPAKKVFASTTPANTSDVNAFADTGVSVIIESRLNGGAGATPWFLAADYKRVDTVEYCYLEGDDGVFMDERQGFTVDQIEYKARLEFASKAIDYRGLYKNPGV